MSGSQWQVPNLNGAFSIAASYFNGDMRNPKYDLTFFQNNIIAPLFEHEGGRANRSLKADPGGLTFLGISQEFPQVRNHVMGLWRSGDREGALQTASQFYFNQFWKPTVDRVDMMYPNLDQPSRQALLSCCFDMSVMSSSRAVDRVLRASEGNPIKFMMERWEYYKGLPNFTYNQGGWRNRIEDGIEKALNIISFPAEQIGQKVADLFQNPQLATDLWNDFKNSRVGQMLQSGLDTLSSLGSAAKREGLELLNRTGLAP